MRKYIFLMVGLLSLFITGCGNEKAQTNENVSTVEVIKPDASYGEDMVTLSGYDFSTGYSCIKVYNPMRLLLRADLQIVIMNMLPGKKLLVMQ